MFENYSPEERLRKINRVKIIVKEYRTILEKNCHLTCQQAFQKLNEKYGIDCPSKRTLLRWKKNLP